MILLEADFNRFVANLCTRLAAGAATYGDLSFTRPLVELIDELQQELEDIAGWGLILWVRLERLRSAVKHAERSGGSNG